MSTDARSPTHLLLTIGVGQHQSPAGLETSLYTPIGKSLLEGAWRRIILLPSRASMPHAEVIRQRHPGLAIEISPLSGEGDENDVDRCFAHFEQVVAGVVGEAGRPGSVAVDFTRGTKAMSVALGLAAAAHQVTHWRYVTGPRSELGTVAPGQEQVVTLSPVSLALRQRLNHAADLFAAGQFAAAARLAKIESSALPSGEEAASDGHTLGWLADFWGAWDRFAYQHARELARCPPQPRRWSGWMPSPEQIQHLAQLAAPVASDPAAREPRAMAARLRLLAADLIQNACRRLYAREMEDVLVRAYRVLELIGQARLFDRGLDSERISVEAAPTSGVLQKFAAWLAYKEQKKSPVRAQRDGSYSLSRENVASFLKSLGDPLARDLLDERRFADLSPIRRNRSLLIHGYEAQTASSRGNSVATVLKQITALLEKDCQAAAVRALRLSRFPAPPVESLIKEI